MQPGIRLTLDNIAHHSERMEKLLDAGDQAGARRALEEAHSEAGTLATMLKTIDDTFFAGSSQNNP